MRLQGSLDPRKSAAIKEFFDYLLRIGDGREGEDNDGEAQIKTPDELIIRRNGKKPVQAIVHYIYNDFALNYEDSHYFKDRAILCPTNDVVSEINEYMLSLLPGSEEVYMSYDSIDQADSMEGNHEDDLFSSKYLNSIKYSGLPNHEIRLKVRAPIMLLRNIDSSQGLCNGTRLRVVELGKHVIYAEQMTCSVKRIVFIPRLDLTPSDIRLPFKLKRCQFSITINFAMTINKSQGQSLGNVGIYLPKPPFSHGQLYVAMSRVTSKKGLKFLITNSEGDELTSTTNVVYKEVFSKIR